MPIAGIVLSVGPAEEEETRDRHDQHGREGGQGSQLEKVREPGRRRAPPHRPRVGVDLHRETPGLGTGEASRQVVHDLPPPFERKLCPHRTPKLLRSRAVRTRGSVRAQIAESHP